MALPREPRQKMINMMYLVLTALLALNVSSEILNAFKTVNKSLETTNTTVNTSTSAILKSLQDKMRTPETAERANIWYPKAQAVQQYSAAIYNYIQSKKDEIIRLAGGDITKRSFKSDNLDIATRMFVDKGEGKKLLQMLTEYKANILTKIDPKIDSAFRASLPIDLEIPRTQSKSNKTWERAYFHMVPTVAALTILSKFQNDVRTTENRLVQFCHEQVGKVEVIFDTYAAIVGQNSTYLMPGQELEITAGVGAFSKAALPSITIGGQNVPIGPDGQAVLKMQAGGVGSRSVPVRISFKDQNGVQQTIEKNVEYTVGSANASIALDKMNVLYIGVDNPVTIAASGGGDDKVQASITQGSLTRVGPGKYIARVNSVADDVRINVMVDGKLAGAAQFRVRTIPESQAYVGGQPSGANMTAGAFRAQGGVAAGIKNFPFELQYQVVSFTFTCDTDDGDIVSVPVQGNAFEGAVRTAINTHVKPGKLVTIDNIRVRQPDGRTASAPSLIYYIK
ncbi:MAG TPA: gliding motility protein GldM [Chitinophagaceae bacterium]|nr:gliding motility protein GldM [Chitinophagaceae bacterium]